jgi:hypothetical protein
MRSIVIIPTFDRPEFLALCLEHLKAAEMPANTQVWLCEDIHTDKPKHFTVGWEMLGVVREFEAAFRPEARTDFKTSFRYIGRSGHSTYGNSYNVLSALCEASLQPDVDLVYLIEDDVLITKDFFQWNELVHKKFSPWASCAGPITGSLNFAMNGPEAFTSNGDVHAVHQSNSGAYLSWATCFSKSAMREFATWNPAYNTFGPGQEQDILIQRMLTRERLMMIFPYVPRAYHMGWYSYHLPGGLKPTGTLLERMQCIRSASTNSQRIRELAGYDWPVFQEHKATSELYVKSRFPK